LTPMDMADMLSRHLAGDWGDVCQEDKESNDLDVIHGNRLISAYHVNDIKVWIITEANRSLTTILLPSDC
jgi:hypothetical protein